MFAIVQSKKGIFPLSTYPVVHASIGEEEHQDSEGKRRSMSDVLLRITFNEIKTNFVSSMGLSRCVLWNSSSGWGRV